MSYSIFTRRVDVAQSKWNSKFTYAASEYFWQCWVIVTRRILNPAWPWKKKNRASKAKQSQRQQLSSCILAGKWNIKRTSKGNGNGWGTSFMRGKLSCFSDMCLLAEAGAPRPVRVCVPSLWSQRPITTEFQLLLLPSSPPPPHPTRKNNPCSSALYIPSGIRSYLKNETFGFVNIISNHFTT